ncbi:MAG: hypothetical protein QXK37_04405 [Candidatus Woesearchaeota archaeon]
MALNVSLNNFTFSQSISEISLSELSAGAFYESIIPLVYFVAGITIYGLFIFKFYRWLAKKDILGLELHRHSERMEGFFKSFFYTQLYVLENLIMIPIFILFCSAILALLLIMLAKTQSAEKILLTSVALVASVRIICYYNEDLAKDVAKMIPFTLLGVFIIDSTYFSLENSLASALQIPTLWRILLYYLLFVIIIEFAMRIIHSATSKLWSEEKAND